MPGCADDPVSSLLALWSHDYAPRLTSQSTITRQIASVKISFFRVGPDGEAIPPFVVHSGRKSFPQIAAETRLRIRGTASPGSHSRSEANLRGQATGSEGIIGGSTRPPGSQVGPHHNALFMSGIGEPHCRSEPGMRPGVAQIWHTHHPQKENPPLAGQASWRNF
jgi:hypothetical protein